MKFKNLTESQKNRIHQVYNEKDGTSWEKRAAMLGDEFGVSERTIRKWCSEKLGLKEKFEVEPEQYVKAKERKYDKDRKNSI
jgi:hypothetical protein